MRHWILILLVCIAAGFKSQAQVSFSFVPELQGRTVDGLFQVRTMNAGARKTVNLQMTVTEKSAGLIVRIQTSAFDLMPGNNPLPASVARQAGLTFSNDKAAAVTRQSGYFLEGDYDFCFELVEGKAGGSVLAEQCFSYMLQPFSPLLLVKPADGEQTCDKRPAFFWQPLLPAVPGVQYRLALVELKPRQAKTEAMNINIPLINQRNINTPMLFFPAVNKDLEEGKVYAWQVTAYKGATMLAQSEIWEFKCQCSPEEKDSQPEAFRDIEDLARGNFYLAEGRIFFALRNPYAAGNLSYSIVPITDVREKIKKLRKVKLERGQNNIVIDLRDNASIVDGHYYQLQVKLPNGDMRVLRFLYKMPATL